MPWFLRLAMERVLRGSTFLDANSEASKWSWLAFHGRRISWACFIRGEMGTCACRPSERDGTELILTVPSLDTFPLSSGSRRMVRMIRPTFFGMLLFSWLDVHKVARMELRKDWAAFAILTKIEHDLLGITPSPG